jgi:hypothetical protein
MDNSADEINEENITPATAEETSAQVAVEEEEGTGTDDEIDDEAIIEGAAESSVQIAPTSDTNPIAQEQDDPMLFVQLGDRIVIDSRKYGRTIGTVYYRSLELISVKPDGVSNMLHNFELEQTDDEELYKEDDGVTTLELISLLIHLIQQVIYIKAIKLRMSIRKMITLKYRIPKTMMKYKN